MDMLFMSEKGEHTKKNKSYCSHIIWAEMEDLSTAENKPCIWF